MMLHTMEYIIYNWKYIGTDNAFWFPGIASRRYKINTTLFRKFLWSIICRKCQPTWKNKNFTDFLLQKKNMSANNIILWWTTISFGNVSNKMRVMCISCCICSTLLSFCFSFKVFFFLLLSKAQIVSGGY